MEELDLKELFSIFWNKKGYIAIIVAIFIVIGMVYTMTFVSPKYKSETSLLLVKTGNATTTTEGTSTEAITQTDVTLNQKLVSTYSELIKSKSVIREVIQNLNLLEDENDIRRSITVSSVKDTELIKIVVTHDNPQTAKIIANEIANVFTEMVAETYKINNVNIIDAAEVEEQPYNINHAKDVFIFAFIGFVIAVVYVLIANMLDNTVKTVEDIEKSTGLFVLASIPEYTQVEDKGGKR